MIIAKIITEFCNQFPVKIESLGTSDHYILFESQMPLEEDTQLCNKIRLTFRNLCNNITYTVHQMFFFHLFSSDKNNSRLKLFHVNTQSLLIKKLTLDNMIRDLATNCNFRITEIWQNKTKENSCGMSTPISSKLSGFI